jgi:poly-beta-1,6-N-acetyl-D-glucosamine synthase
LYGIAIASFFACAFLIVWVLFGYPALLGVVAKRRARLVRKEFQPRHVSVILAVHNGATFLRRKLESLLDLDYPPELVDILVVSDGSTDQTESIAREFAFARVRFIAISRGGKAAALNAGITEALGEILFFTDVRQTLGRDSLRHLVACFADPAVGAVSGELIIVDEETREEASVGLYWKYEKWIRKHQSNLDSMLGATGAIYAMRRELAVKLPPHTLNDDMHLPLAAFFRGYRVVMEPAAIAYDSPASLDAEFHRKVRTLAGVYQVIARYPALLGPGNRMWVHFISHKFGRLLLPFALLIGLATSFFLPAPLNWIALTAYLGLAVLGVLDTALGEGSALKRLTAPARTFGVLMAATLAAASYPFRDPASFWKTSKIQALQKSSKENVVKSAR